MSFLNNINFNKILNLLKSSDFSLAKNIILEDQTSYVSDPYYYNLLGFVYFKLESYSDAEQSYLKAINLKENYFEAKYNLAILYYTNKQIDKAKNIFMNLIKEDEFNFKYNFNLGIIFFDQKIYKESLKYIKICCQINPKSYEACHQLGLIYEKDKNFNDAIKYYEIANKINSYESVITLNNLGTVYLFVKKYDKSIECFKKILTKKNNFSKLDSGQLSLVLNNMGNANLALEKYEEAIEYFRKALELDKNRSLILNNIGIAYSKIGEIKKALEFWHKSLLLNNKDLNLRQKYLFYLLYDPEEYFLYKEKAIEYRKNIENFEFENKFFFKSTDKNKKLNIGFVSGDFRQHPVGYFLLDILELIMKKNFKLTAYSNSKTEDKYTGIFKKNFDDFYCVTAWSDVELSKKILEDKIDILIDLSGFSSNTRLKIFRYKLAPIQITWAGWLASTGIKEIDYIIGDSFVTPKNHKEQFVEKILQLPNIWCHLSSSDIKHLKTSTSPALINKYITFGSFNNADKINSTVIKVWSEILASIPFSVLFLKNFQLKNPFYKKKIIREFENNNINLNRLILEESSKREELLLSYNKIDIALDTFPYCGGTTSFELSWMGVPLLTLEGTSFISRCGASINKNLNQNDWIAKDTNDYIKKAVEFSANYNSLDSTRSYLRKNSRNSMLFNSNVFAENFCYALRNVWSNFVNNI